MSLKDLSQDVSLSCSYSQIVSLETFVANGFLTHSEFRNIHAFKIQWKLFLQSTQVVDEKRFVSFFFIVGTTYLKTGKKFKNFTLCFFSTIHFLNSLILSFWVRVLIWGPRTNLFKLLGFQEYLLNRPVFKKTFIVGNFHHHWYHSHLRIATPFSLNTLYSTLLRKAWRVSQCCSNATCSASKLSHNFAKNLPLIGLFLT